MRHPVFIAVALAIASCLTHALLPRDWSRDIFAVVLGALGGVYVGGAVSRGVAMEIAVAVAGSIVCLAAAVAGLRGPEWIIAVGFIAHGVWDWAYHVARSRTVGHWWPPFCAAYDWLVGGYLLASMVWAGRG